jgi:hypothetical protein
MGFSSKPIPMVSISREGDYLAGNPVKNGEKKE